MNLKIAVLASGNLGQSTLEAISLRYKPSLIATDSKSVGIIELAKKNNIPLFIGNPREKRLSQFISNVRFDLIVAINYIFILEADVIQLSKYAINIHGSLLPKYRGRTPHVWAIINNEKVTGVSAHFLDKDCDTGDIIIQKNIKIDNNDTGDSILKKFSKIYPKIVFEIIRCTKKDSFIRAKQDETKATYFGKRTPDDGKINWDWHKERIFNWIRAQSFPYPGAFTYYRNKKVIIDEIKYSDYGYSHDIKNGTILRISPSIIVKSPNGTIELLRIRDEDLIFNVGEILL